MEVEARPGGDRESDTSDRTHAQMRTCGDELRSCMIISEVLKS